LKNIRKIVSHAFIEERHIAPLAVFRIAFGAVMLISTVRFMLKGWVTEFYVKPVFHFTFYGFDWIKPFGETGLLTVFIIMSVAAVGIMLGYYYRISIAFFFFGFLYVELLDKTYYLNHYYLVTLISFLLLLVPANRYFSLDVWRRPSIKATHVPGWTITIFKLQILLVYFFSGLSKLNQAWLFDALPLKIWLPASEHLPIIGFWLKQTWIAYLFSWFGAAYDLSIGFFLMNGKTRSVAFIALVIFHLLTAILFKIGMFPYIMIVASIIFFSGESHWRIVEKIRQLFKVSPAASEHRSLKHGPMNPITKSLLIIYFAWQVITPLRFVLYPGNILWTEDGYRFSWRVMLMEKSGLAFFYVRDPQTSKKVEVPTSRFLTGFQERMMATQPDMILQYAHFLDREYRSKGVTDPIITTQSYVTLNGSGSQLYIDSSVDLSRKQEGFYHKSWVLSPDKSRIAK
jgi:hypothetical protein